VGLIKNLLNHHISINVAVQHSPDLRVNPKKCKQNVAVQQLLEASPKFGPPRPGVQMGQQTSPEPETGKRHNGHMAETVYLEPDPDNPELLKPATRARTPGRGPTARPTLAFMASHPAHAIALGFGSGLARFAPGTVGTLWSWATFLVLEPWLNDASWAVVIAANLLLGWWACTVTARHMGLPDSSHMVWDEVVAFWIVLWVLTPVDFWTQLYAFVLFRVFDAVKIGPMAWADQTFKGFGPRGGFGVMLDLSLIHI